MPNVDENMKALELSYITGEYVKLYRHFSKQFGSFLQRIYLPMKSNPITRYLSKKNENKRVVLNGYNSLIYDGQKLEITQVSVNKGMEK